jgi:hypothetical protein
MNASVVTENRTGSRLASVSLAMAALSVAVAQALTMHAGAGPAGASEAAATSQLAFTAASTVTLDPAAMHVTATRNFSCLGSGPRRVTERMVTGTVTSNLVLTNVTVTQTHQIINNTQIAQPIVVLESRNPPGRPDPGSELIVFRLNEESPATANDVGKFVELYQFNLSKPLPAGPEFEAGLYFSTSVGAAGPARNEFRWSRVGAGGAYSMKCRYVSVAGQRPAT